MRKQLVYIAFASAACSSHDAAPVDAAADLTCGELPTLQACFQCCGSAHVDGATLYTHLSHDCACRADVCAIACADSFCAGHEPSAGDACDQCIGDAFAETGPGICREALANSCDANVACAQYSACLPRCAGKP